MHSRYTKGHEKAKETGVEKRKRNADVDDEQKKEDKVPAESIHFFVFKPITGAQNKALLMLFYKA